MEKKPSSFDPQVDCAFFPRGRGWKVFHGIHRVWKYRVASRNADLAKAFFADGLPVSIPPLSNLAPGQRGDRGLLRRLLHDLQNLLPWAARIRRCKTSRCERRIDS